MPLRFVSCTLIFLFAVGASATGEVGPLHESDAECDDGVHSADYDVIFRGVGRVAGVDWCLLKSQAIAESSLNPEAESPAGAIGLSQFLPSTWRWLLDKYDLPSSWEPRNPVDAIAMQGVYMVYLLERCRPLEGRDRFECALGSYNAGEGRVRRLLRGAGNLAWAAARDALPTETTAYISKNVKRALRLRRGR